MRILIMILTGFGLLFSARVDRVTWPKGRTFSSYLNANDAGDVLRTIPAEDMEYVREIQPGETYYELRDHGRLLQALIPLGDAMQIQVLYRGESGYHFDIVPIVYRPIHDALSFEEKDGYLQQITRLTHHPRLGKTLGRLFGNDPLFRRLRPQDRFALEYTQKERLGTPLGRPRISGALVKTHGKLHFIYVDKKGHAYKDGSKTVTVTTSEDRPFTYTTVRKAKTKRFCMPVDHPRITSRFSLRRWHPILHKYRPHFGVDFGARRGTALHAVNDGRVVYAGWMRGYGKVVKIDHGGGFVSLYAHQSKIRVTLKQHVKQGQIIGYVGSTGRSTGPHLHFGLYVHGKPVDPLHYLTRQGTGKVRTIVEKHTVMKRYPVSKIKRIPLPGAKQSRKRLESLIQDLTEHPYSWHQSQRNSVPIGELRSRPRLLVERQHG